MEIECRPGSRPGELVVVVRGDLDLYASVAFANEMMNQFQAGATRIVLDLGDVRYLDSSGVGALIRLLQKARSLGGELRVARLSGTPLRVLEMSNILSLLKTHPDVESALKAWS